MPSIDTKPELTAKASMAQPVSQPAVYANGLNKKPKRSQCVLLKETLDDICVHSKACLQKSSRHLFQATGI
jgi:hypothetical protein